MCLLDYFQVRQLNLLLRYIEEREAAETRAKKPTSAVVGAAKDRAGDILQYQSALSNTTDTSYSMAKDKLSSPVDAYNSLRFNDVPFKAAEEHLQDGAFHFARD